MKLMIFILLSGVAVLLVMAGQVSAYQVRQGWLRILPISPAMAKIVEEREMRYFVSLRGRNRLFPQHLCIGMLSTLLLICLMLSSVVLAPLKTAYANSASEPAGNISDVHDLQTFLDHTFAEQMQKNHIPGATVSVVKDGRVLYAKGYGKANIQHDIPVSANTTIFRIASVSKLFTWTAVMQLVEQGKLNLHTDVNHYLKTFQIPATYPQPITLAHLLTHTAGFEDTVGSDEAERSLGAWLASNIPARVRPPGELASYSNYGAALAGYIVQQISGLPFDRYIEEHIYQPLGMNHSTFRQPIPAPLNADQAQGYAFKNKRYQATPFEYMQDTPAGSMDSTATDMARFMIAHLQDGRFENKRILQTATAQEMHQRQFTNDPRIPGMTYGFYEQNTNNQHIIEHGGDIVSFHALLSLLPLQHLGLFASYNSDGGAQARANLWQSFLNRYFPAPQMTAPKPLAGFAERAEQITGSYWPTRRSYTTFEKLGVLPATINVQTEGNGEILIQGPQATVTAVEVKPWLFRQVNGQLLIAFQVGQNRTIMLINSALDANTKLAWYETPTFHLVLLSLSFLLFLSVFVLLLGLLIYALRLRRAGKPHSRHTNSSIARWIMSLVSGVNILILLISALFVWLVMSMNLQGLASFEQYGFIPLIILAFASVILAVGSVIGAAYVWKKRLWVPALRLHYTLAALAALAIVWELSYWNLLKL